MCELVGAGTCLERGSAIITHMQSPQNKYIFSHVIVIQLKYIPDTYTMPILTRTANIWQHEIIGIEVEKEINSMEKNDEFVVLNQ